MKSKLFYTELISPEVNGYELKKFRVQHDEVQLAKYLKNCAKKHQKEKINQIFLVRDNKENRLIAWFALKAATLPYKDEKSPFLLPAVELTHFAVDERYRGEGDMRTGEYIFENHILPEVKASAEHMAVKALFVFAINTPKLIGYYKNRLGFKEIKNIDDEQFSKFFTPKYDDGGKFLYLPL